MRSLRGDGEITKKMPDSQSLESDPHFQNVAAQTCSLNHVVCQYLDLGPETWLLEINIRTRVHGERFQTRLVNM